MVAELGGATDLVDLTQRVKEVFARFRADDRRGFLTRPEMQKMLNDLIPNSSYKVIDKLLREINGDDGDGKFTTPEFVTWLIGKGRNVHSQTGVVKAIVSATGDSLGARVSEIFDRYDVDGSGQLERHELMKVLRVLDCEITTEEIQRVLHELDTSRDGKVSYKEFLGWLKEGDALARKLASKLRAVTGPVREQRVKEAFDMYDISGDGLLDMEEMRNAMSKMFLFNQEEVHRICQDLDTSNDGVISYKEFSGWMRRGTHSKEVLKGKTILAPIDSDGLDAVFYVFCGPGKTEMEMKDFVKFCKNCQITDSTLPVAAAELVFNDHRVKAAGRRTLDFFEFGAALEMLAERKHMKVTDLHTLALLTGGPQAKLVSPKTEQSKGGSRRRSSASQRKKRAKKLQPILQDKDAWKRDVDNGDLWKVFGLDTSAGRQLRQIYGPKAVNPTPEPMGPMRSPVRSVPQLGSHQLSLQKIKGTLDLHRLSPSAAGAAGSGMTSSVSLPLIESRPPAADHAKAPASHL